NTPVNVSLGSATAVVQGQIQFLSTTSTPSAAVINLNSTAPGGPVLSLSGTISSDGSLMISSQPVTAGGAARLTITGSAGKLSSVSGTTLQAANGALAFQSATTSATSGVLNLIGSSVTTDALSAISAATINITTSTISHLGSFTA